MAKREHMRDKSDAELDKLLVETRSQLREERFAASGARAKDPNQATRLRKVIARVLTEQRARSLTGAPTELPA
jgi:ribosomal protein L29